MKRTDGSGRSRAKSAGPWLSVAGKRCARAGFRRSIDRKVGAEHQLFNLVHHGPRVWFACAWYLARKEPECPRRLSPKARRKQLDAFLKPFRITNGKDFKLSKMKPGATPGVKSKEDAQSFLKRGVEFLAEMQDKLYAQDQWGVLLIFQAMDAAGKDGAIKHVMSGINPQGCQVFSFKGPSAEELDHDFLWRTSRRCPSGAGSASSTARTTRRSSSCACTPRSSRNRSCRGR